MLGESDVKTLESILFAPEYGEHALDVFGLHGAVAADVVSPDPLDCARIFAVATGQAPQQCGQAPQAFAELIERMGREIRQILEQGHSFELPEPEDEDSADEAIENWCAGFTDVFMLDEERWLQWDENHVGELMTPILTLSNLFDDEVFQHARKDPGRFADYSQAIPELLTDLYLHFHSP